VIVLDASAAAAVVLNERGSAEQVRARLAETRGAAHVPHLFDLEVVQAIRGHLHGGRLERSHAERALVSASQLRLRRWPHHPFRDRIWALRDNVTAYDAVYLALAELLDLPLVTTDARLAATDSTARVELLGAYS
jgi:predicted nucleic acid-binding protein